MTRLQTYRAFLAAMSPAAPPSDALARGFYVEPPGGGVWSAISKKLELEPASTHLVLGGIGSGKTSELLFARERLSDSLSETGDLVWYCDVSQSHDLGATPEPGVLFALTSQLLIRAARAANVNYLGQPGLNSAVDSLMRLAITFTDWVPDDPDEDRCEPEEPETHPMRPVVNRGVLSPPEHERIDHRLAYHVPALQKLLATYPGEGHTAMVLFDSLDRLPQPASFQTIVKDDVKALKAAGIGVVVVGPVRFIVGNDRALTDLFDEVHFQLATDPNSNEGMAFLCEVLRRRDEGIGLLNEECLPALAFASGGNLRDLIALAKRSAEEAYAAGHPTITSRDVDRASKAFGRNLALGLDDDQVKILKAVAQSGAFVVRGERELSLLETRRVLLYRDNRWRVHPTLRALLESIPELTA